MNQHQAEILEDLAWDNAPSQIKAGFISALQEAEHSYLIRPTEYVRSWENASIVFLMLSDTEIEQYLLDLLNWLKDLNWPGAEFILKRLQRVSSDLLCVPLENAAKLASASHDEQWLAWISILIANSNMINLLNADTISLLKPFALEYWNWDYDSILALINRK